MFENIKNQDKIYKRWGRLVEAGGDIKDDTIKMSTAIILENTQQAEDNQHSIRYGRSILSEQITPGISTAGSMGPNGTSYADTATINGNGDARVPSVVIPMIRRIYPQLLAHKLVGVQPMNGPIGMAFAYRAKYGRFGRGASTGYTNEGDEIGYLNNHAGFTGRDLPSGQIEGAVDISAGTASNDFATAGGSVNVPAKADYPTNILSCFFGAANSKYLGVERKNGQWFGDGADTSNAETWAVGSTMPEAGFEFLKATVTAKERKLGVQITRETEEDMKAMQGMNAQNEINNIISYEIAQEIDRQLLGEIVQSAVRAGNTMMWNPANADGRNQAERIDTLYTTILNKSAAVATQSRRGAANWCVASPGAAALLESHIYNPLGVAGGLGNANAFGKEMDNNIGVVEIGTLRNGTIKLYRDTLAGGDYILLGYKGNSVYDAGVIYLPYIPLELMHAVDPMTFNPVTAARTRYGVTTNLFGAGQFYQFIGLGDLAAAVTGGTAQFVQF